MKKIVTTLMLKTKVRTLFLILFLNLSRKGKSILHTPIKSLLSRYIVYKRMLTFIYNFKTLSFLSRFKGQRGDGECISLTALYRFHPLHRHLDISRTITAQISPLQIASSRTRTGNLFFPSAS